MSHALGKLKKTTKQRCPECGKHLQLRSNRTEIVTEEREIIISEEEYLYCPNCEYEEPVEAKKKHRGNDRYDGYSN